MNELRQPPLPIDLSDLPYPMQEVDSTCASAVGYDDHLWTLYIEYRSTRKIYIYTGVPPSVYFELMNAGSIGNFIVKVLKPGYYCIPED